MNTGKLEVLLQRDEGQLLEYKREWPDLTSRRGKAELARDVMAMADGLGENDVGYIVFGRDEPRCGGEVVGVDDVPTFEDVMGVLAPRRAPPDFAG